MLASFWDLAAEHFISFTGGLIVGFMACSRYRLVRRNGEEAK